MAFHQFSSTGNTVFQVIVCSATLHSFDVKKLSERIMHFPTWVDLKGEDSVPETVHHVVVPVNPKSDRLWERLGKNHIRVSLVLLWDARANKTSFLVLYNCHSKQKCKAHCCCQCFVLDRRTKSMLKTTPGLEPILQVRVDMRVRCQTVITNEAQIHVFKFFIVLPEEMWSEAIKVLKGEYTVRAIKEHKMDQAIIFCRTKIDCDNMEQYFIQQGGGVDKAHSCKLSLHCLHIYTKVGSSPLFFCLGL